MKRVFRAVASGSLVGLLLVNAASAYVIPIIGGGQVSASMKHADITFDGTSIGVHVDNSVDTPLLRPLTPPDEFDPSASWSVLQDKAYNFQYGWNPGGFITVPRGTWIWIEQLASSPGLEVYQRPPATPAYEPIFGTTGSSTLWKWSGSMTHNVYAVLDPLESSYESTYRVFIGDEDTGEASPGYQSAEVTFVFDATPLLTADFNVDGQVDGQDLTLWETNAGMASGASQDHGDANGDGSVDGSDFLQWQIQYGSGLSELSPTLAAVPEPAVLPLVLLGVLLSTHCRFCGRASLERRR